MASWSQPALSVGQTPRRFVLHRVLVVTVGLYILGTIIGGIGLGWMALHPRSPRVTANEDRNARGAAENQGWKFGDVAITAADGVSLQAWFMRPQQPNGGAVILLHGVSDNRLEMYGYGKWLAANGYMVLLPDARAHGNSGGIATYGLKEADDIHRWIEWLANNEQPHCFFGIGESMGAAEILESLPGEPRFCAVVAESPFATFREVAYARFGRPFHTGPWLGRTLLRPTVEAGFLYVRIRYGLNMEKASPEDSVAKSTVPVLLIHGLEDHNIPNYHSDLIQARNRQRVSVWKVPGAAHTGAHKAAPEEFERRGLDWFAEHSTQETGN